MLKMMNEPLGDTTTSSTSTPDGRAYPIHRLHLGPLELEHSRVIPEHWPNVARVRAGIEQLPLPLGDDFDGATDHFDRSLVVDCVRRDRQTGRPELGGGHRVVWHCLVVQVREHREVDEAQQLGRHRW